MSFTFVLVRPPTLLDDGKLDTIIGPLVRALERRGGRVGSEAAIGEPEPLFYLVATGGTEREILRLDGRRATSDDPVYLIAHPSNNSLPSALEVLARLQQDGRRGQIFSLDGPNDSRGLEAISVAAENLQVHHALRSGRIGLVGPPSDWLVASSPNPDTVQRIWGPAVIELDMAELVESIQQVSHSTIEHEMNALAADASDIVEPSADDQVAVAGVLGAMESIVERHRLDALSVRCFDLVLDHRTTGCVALARLNDRGVIAGCEGDLVSTVGMMWVRELLGEIPWMANPARLDPGRNTLWLAHCTVPLSLVRSYRLRSHFESGLGVAIQGTVDPQPVTLLRIGGRDLRELWLAEGRISASGSSEALCRTQVEIELGTGHVEDLLRRPLGNHLVMTPGHHADRLGGWWNASIRPLFSEGAN